jgi:hypothetical protein
MRGLALLFILIVLAAYFLPVKEAAPNAAVIAVNVAQAAAPKR